MNDIFRAGAALFVVAGIYVVYFAAILAFIWIVWNWIVLPGLPQLMAAMS